MKKYCNIKNAILTVIFFFSLLCFYKAFASGGVSPGQPISAAVTNAAFFEKNAADTDPYIATFSNTTDSSSTSTGSLITAGGFGVAKKIYVGGGAFFAAPVTITDSTQSTSTSTGSVILTGGLGMAKNLYVGGLFSTAGPATVLDSTQSSSSSTGSIIASGGIGAAKNITAGGTVLGSNLSGTNSGDVTLGAFGSSPSSTGGSLSVQVLTLQPADGTHPGGVSTTTQTMAGAKTFSTSVQSPAFISSTSTPATAGTVELADPDAIEWRNHANSGNVSLAKSTSDQLTYGGTALFNSSGVQQASSFPALTGDVTNSAGSLSTSAAATQNNITSIPNLATVGTIGTGVWNGTRLTGSYIPTDVAYVDGNNTFTAWQTSSYAGIASHGAFSFTGSPYTGGNATTNKPQILIEDAGTSNAWSANGTYLGINAKTGFTGMLLDMQLNAVSKFSVLDDGTLTLAKYGTGILHSSSAGAITSSAVDLSGADATGIMAAARMPALTGDVTSSSGAVATTIASSAVTNSKIANGTIDLTAKVTGVLPVANGGTNSSSVVSTPAATAWAGWDANKNMSGNIFMPAYTTAATANSTTAMVVGSSGVQYFTGSTSGQVVTMPVTSTLTTSPQWTQTIVNLSTQTVTVESSGGNTIQAMAANTKLILRAIGTTHTTTVDWDWDYSAVEAGLGGSGTVTSVQVAGANGISFSGGPITTSGTITASLTTPAVSRNTSTGSAAGCYFNISSGNATVGSTYTNNSITFTTLFTVASATTVWMTGSSCGTSGGTLTKSGGSGDSTLTFSLSTAIAAITITGSPLYLDIELLGGGGGGGGGGTGSFTSGTGGTATGFASGSGQIIASGGGGANAAFSGGGGGGSCQTQTIGTLVDSVNGQTGSVGVPNTTSGIGGNGGGTFYGGGGAASGGGTGGNGVGNTGAGGGGGYGGSAGADYGGEGGGGGGYCHVYLNSPSGTYYYLVGGGGAAGGAGTGAGSAAGGTGAAGLVKAVSKYQ